MVYSLLLLPVLYLRGNGRQLLEQLASFCSRPWAILLLALPVAVIEAALGTEESGGWNRYTFIPFLLYGFLLAADPRFGEAIRRHTRAALLVGVPAMFMLLGLGFYVSEFAGQDPAVAYDGWSVLWRFVKGIGPGHGSSRSWEPPCRSSDDAPGSPHRQFSANPGRMIQ